MPPSKFENARAVIFNVLLILTPPCSFKYHHALLLTAPSSLRSQRATRCLYLVQEDREYRDFIAILLDFKGVHDRYILGHRIYGAQEDAFIEVCETLR